MSFDSEQKFHLHYSRQQECCQENVSVFVQKLLRRYDNTPVLDLYDIAEFHAEFEKIHPFYDGNGRIGRLLILKQCLESGIVPFFINEEIKHFYYMGLKEWQSDEKKERLIDVFLSTQDDMKVILDYFRIDYDRNELTARELINKHI